MAAKSTTDANKDKVREHLEIIGQLEADYAKRDKLYEEIESVVYQKKEPRVPRGYPRTSKVQNPLAPHIINTVTAALSMNPYTVQFDPVSIGPTGEQNASLREHFFNAAWARQEREKKRRLFRVFMHSLTLKGEGVMKTIERTKRAWSSYDQFQSQLSTDLANVDHPEYGDIADRAKKSGDMTERDRVYNAKTEEKKRELPYPIESTDVPPETFYSTIGDDGMSYAAEVKNVPYYQCLEKYNKGLSGDGKIVPASLGLAKNKWSSIMSGGKTLKMYEAWRWDEAVYFMAGPGDAAGKSAEYVRTVKHGYGDPYLKTLRGPYFHCYGITTSSRENHLMGLSVLFGWLKLFPWLDELLTILGAAAYAYGYPSYRRKGGPDEGGRTQPGAFGRDQQDRIDKEIPFEPGDILPWDIEPIESPRSGPDLGEGIKICRDLIELCLPAVVQGLVNGDESGYLASQATHLARLVWQPIVDNSEFALAERTSFESWLIDQKIGEDVYVWGEEARPSGYQRKKPRMMWLGIGPDDIKGIHAYNVKLNPSTPSQDVIKVRTHDEMLKLKLETRDQAIIDMGNNPDEVNTYWLLDELKAQLVPDIIAAAKAKVLAKQQAQTNRVNEAEAAGGAGGGNNGRTGTAEVIQPGQNGEPIQPTPAGQAGQDSVGPAGGIGAPSPVTPGPPVQAG